MNRRIAVFLERPRIKVLAKRFAKQLAFVRARLSPQSYLGLQLTVGAVVLIGASWLFGGIAEDVVTGDPLTIVDVLIAQWLHAHTPPLLIRFMLAVTQLHDPAPLGFYALLLAFVLPCKRNWVWLLIVGLAVPGGMLINVMMKLAFQRARPAFDDPILSLMT